MRKLVVLSLGQGDLQSGFPTVTAILSQEGDARTMKFAGSLPPDPEIEQLYIRWHLLYEALAQRLGQSLRIKIIPEDAVQISSVEFSDICQQLKIKINKWLNSEEFRRIDQQLRREFHPSDEIRFVIETNNIKLRRISWHLWNIFEDYPRAEVALSSREFRREFRSAKIPLKTPIGQVRILAILGNCEVINIEDDRRLLWKLPGAELVFLEQPQRQELDEQLWDKRGWDILFFAGHSQTDGETGVLYINKNENITICQLKNALKTAIQRGLQLAIFNSCDGLGMASDLADLNIPQIVVMREPVSDRVAHKFLKHFLDSFASGESFYLAVREAREKLQRLEDEYPCATWLPVICQNPADTPPTWQQLRGIEQPSRNPLLPLLASLGVTLLVIGMRSLGLFLLWELQAFDQLMRLRPDEGPDPRLLVVEATEAEINRYGFPLPDGILAQVVEKLERYQPRTIGLDIFRDRPVEPGHAALVRQLPQNLHLIALCSGRDANNPNKPGIKPPRLPKERLGFSNVVLDPDSILRRHLVFMQPLQSDPCTTNYSLSIRLAFHYLATKGIEPQTLPKDRMQLGHTIFVPLEQDAGAYQQTDVRGFQILLNYRKNVAKRVRITDVLSDRINPDLVKDRIVLIGMSAPISGDDFLTPYSASQLPYQKMPGVLVQAQMVSQIISAVLDNRPLLWVWNRWQEAFWIWGWSIVGGLIVWRMQRKAEAILMIAIAVIVLFGVCFILFLQGGWVPLVPSALALLATVSVANVCIILPKRFRDRKEVYWE
ncbi:CHASE2 domain-containing protein [Argonema antarcticum]|uniref:CHASE2 domain-containing protein n=1 Tax=Argonema antarcticum TaxID=2942763 RepID=UPI002011E540|nr:CHASE2 domain-containing protein [Argonema antarcticum]MCL1475378.1 CHASE2 domain-containing protein [Argonema antarcticum A004/B2]